MTTQSETKARAKDTSDFVMRQRPLRSGLECYNTRRELICVLAVLNMDLTH